MATNPLAVDCQQYKEDSNGKVVGVQLGIKTVANSHYEVYGVRLRDEYEAQGNTVARCKVLDKNNVDTGIAVRMSWPGEGPQFQGSALPGNPSNEHFVPNKYWPPSLGPLAFFVGDHNAPQSDIVYGVGLPKGHHVSFDITFRERATVTPPVDPPTDPTEPPITGDIQKEIAKIWRVLEAYGRLNDQASALWLEQQKLDQMIANQTAQNAADIKRLMAWVNSFDGEL